MEDKIEQIRSKENGTKKVMTENGKNNHEKLVREAQTKISIIESKMLLDQQKWENNLNELKNTQ